MIAGNIPTYSIKDAKASDYTARRYNNYTSSNKYKMTTAKHSYYVKREFKDKNPGKENKFKQALAFAKRELEKFNVSTDSVKDICIFYNANPEGCAYDSNQCKRSHICYLCRKSDHKFTECDAYNK